MAKIMPTIGRKLYYIPQGHPTVAKFDDQPIDATIVYVWPQKSPDGKYDLLTLHLIDHSGTPCVAVHVPLVQDGDDVPSNGGYAEWMPYQVGQAAKSVVEQQMQVAQKQAAELNPGVTADMLPNVVAPMGDNGSSQQSSLAQPQPTTLEATPISTAGDSGSGEAYSSDFGGALSALRNGRKVSRSGWNGKGMFAYLVPAASYPAQTGIAKSFFGESSMVPYNAYLALKGADNTVSTWVPSVSDVLADDWIVE